MSQNDTLMEMDGIQGQMDIIDRSVSAEDNPYREMADEARGNLLRIMHSTENEKISKEISLEILDRAGETKHIEQRTAIAVKITDGQIELLMATANEVGLK